MRASASGHAGGSRAARLARSLSAHDSPSRHSACSSVRDAYGANNTTTAHREHPHVQAVILTSVCQLSAPCICPTTLLTGSLDKEKRSASPLSGCGLHGRSMRQDKLQLLSSDIASSTGHGGVRYTGSCRSPWRHSAARVQAAQWTAELGHARPRRPSRPPPPPPAPACTPPPAGPPLHTRSVVCCVRTPAACSAHQHRQPSAAAGGVCAVFALLAAACPRPGACTKHRGADHLHNACQTGALPGCPPEGRRPSGCSTRNQVSTDCGDVTCRPYGDTMAATYGSAPLSPSSSLHSGRACSGKSSPACRSKECCNQQM